MVHYLPYNVSSDVRVEETLTIRAGKAFLRHIPKKGSVVIDGFTEVDSVILQDYQFSCQYALDSLYRDADRVLQFSRTHDGQSISVSYVAIGTVVTADDMNEIKAHIESPHGLPTMSESVKGGAKQGNSLVVVDDTLHVALGTTPLTLEGSMWLNVP